MSLEILAEVARDNAAVRERELFGWLLTEADNGITREGVPLELWRSLR